MATHDVNQDREERQGGGRSRGGPPSSAGSPSPGAAASPVGRAADGAPTHPAGGLRTAADMPTAADLEERLLRALADLDNLRKRAARELAREQANERARVVAAWLPVVDNLELALEHARDETGAVVEGVRTVRDQAVNLLATLGYPRRDETGIPFDPQRHEAVAILPHSEAEPGTVVGVVRPGYGDGDRQLRPAAVVVAGGSE